MRFVVMAANLLLRPRARQRLGMFLAVLTLVGILLTLAFGFALAGAYLILAETFGPPAGALLTAAGLLFIAICMLIGLMIVRRRVPPPPVVDTTTMATLGVLAGLAGVEAFMVARAAKKT